MSAVATTCTSVSGIGRKVAELHQQQGNFVNDGLFGKLDNKLSHVGAATLRFHSGHRNNVFQAKALPQSADKTVITCAADGQVHN